MMPHPVDIHVGQRLRQRRLFLGHSQSAVAEAVGIRFQQVQKYEAGTNRISASRLWQFADFLDVPVSHFFDGLEANDICSDAERRSDLELLQIVKIYLSIPPEKRQRLAHLIEAFEEAS